SSSSSSLSPGALEAIAEASVATSSTAVPFTPSTRSPARAPAVAAGPFVSIATIIGPSGVSRSAQPRRSARTAALSRAGSPAAAALGRGGFGSQPARPSAESATAISSNKAGSLEYADRGEGAGVRMRLSTLQQAPDP